MQFKPIVFKDRIYEKVKITEPVVLELISSKALQRLKKIGQFGVPDEFYHLKNFSRFDHSLGVFTILRKLGASEEEQISGLLHDISHTAFSHVIDWVIGKGDTENYQDTQHQEYSLDPAINRILKKYNYNPARIFNHKNFPLLENEIPNVCADRLDYSLREFPSKIAKQCFSNLCICKNKIVFKNKRVAYLFASTFIHKQLTHWGQFEAVIRYKLFANVLKIALKEKIIKFSDFKKDDNFIKDRLIKSKNLKIQKILSVLKNRSLKNLPRGIKTAHKKFRYVDPLFLKNGKIFRLSRVDKKFNDLIKNSSNANKKGIRLPEITALQ